MSADLHIHVFEGISEVDLAEFFSNTLGSKWFNSVSYNSTNTSYEKVSKTPDVWIGEVSWLKAALFEDGEQYIPSPIQIISDLIGEDLPILTPELKAAILQALTTENITGYRLTTEKSVSDFLEQHMGKRLFKVSW